MPPATQQAPRIATAAIPKCQGPSRELGDLQLLASESGADGCIHLRKGENGSTSVVHCVSSMDPQSQSRSLELAAVAVETSALRSCVLASPTTALLVASPVPGNAHDAVAMRFPCELTEISDAWVDSRSAVATRAASMIAESEHACTPSLATDSTTATEELISLPSWVDLARMTKQKLVQLVIQGKSRWRTLSGVLVTVVGVCLLPFPHTVTCSVVCEPVLRRYVSAPFDATLARSHVLVGQQVTSGDLLATLDGSEVRSQLAAVKAKLAQSEQRELAALSTGDHSKAELERWEVEHLRREVELLQRRKSSLEIRSPIDGVVVTGDLERAEGARLSMGDNLFEIASLQHLVAEVAIAEEDITYVSAEMPASIVVDANPGKKLKTKINRIHLRAEILNNKNVFIAEAELPNDYAQLRPGMNGVASIDAGFKSVGWQVFRRPYYAAREWIGW